MNTEIFMLYLWTRLDVIQVTLVIALVAAVFALGFCLIAIDFNSEFSKDKAEAWKKTAKRVIPWVVGITITLIIIPSKKDAAIIAGGWLVKEAATSEVAKTIGERTYKLIVGKLDEELSKLEGSKK